MSAVADKLDEARALIERGWCQGHAQLGQNVCSLGALQAVLAGAPNRPCSDTLEAERIYGLFADAIGVPRTGFSLVVWNDDKNRFKDEVIEAFRKAAELARAEAQS